MGINRTGTHSQLYKKRPAQPKPYKTRLTGSFAHVIHSQTHKIRGQLSNATGRANRGLQRSLQSFYLDFASHSKRGAATQMLRDDLQPSQYAAFLTLSNACPQTYPQAIAAAKLYEQPVSRRLTNSVNERLKSTDQMLTTILHAL